MKNKTTTERKFQSLKLEDYFKKGKAIIWKGTFAVLQSKKPHPAAFANIMDKKEITVVIEESRIPDKDVIAIESGWKIITFDMVLPFGLCGFLAKISGELARSGISIFVLSSYSTDHILVKKRDLAETVRQLHKLGLRIAHSKSSPRLSS
jgi:hypothetical protein